MEGTRELACMGALAQAAWPNSWHFPRPSRHEVYTMLQQAVSKPLHCAIHLAELGRVLWGELICIPSLLIVRSPSVNLPAFVLQEWAAWQKDAGSDQASHGEFCRETDTPSLTVRMLTSFPQADRWALAAYGPTLVPFARKWTQR